MEARVLLSATPIGLEFKVNSYTTSYQDTSNVAMDAAGNFIVTWTSDGQDGSGYGVYAQRYDASGAANGAEFRVNTTTSNWQMESAVAMASGSFLISWSSFGQDGGGFGIYARLYSASGEPAGAEFRVNTTTSGSQRYSSVAMDSSGNFVVSWTSTDQDGGGDGVYARLYNLAGTPLGSEFRVNTFTTGDQRYSTVAMDFDGDFVVTWKSELQDGDGFGICAQRYNASGVAQGSEFQVNSFTAGNQIDPTVAIDHNGNFVISWTSWFQDSSENGIYARRYNSAGSAQGSEFKVNSETLSNQEYSAAAMDDDGDFVITWLSRGQDPGGSSGIYAQRYTAAGAPQGSEFRVNLSTTLDQINPVVGMDASGNFVVVWESPDVDQLGVYAQRFLADGPVQLLGSVLQISGSSLADTITVTSVAGATVSLNVVLNGVVFPFAPSRVSGIIINALAGHDVVTVNSNVLLPTMIDGGAGDDTLTGGAGDDQLTGADGSDTLAGRSGKDTYVFAAASVAESDTLAEAADDGTDTLNFAFLASSVVVNLASTSIQPVHTNRRLKLNSASVFENIVGGSGADTLFGNGLDNTLSGNAGNDKLLGAGGNDLLYGGADNDTYMFVPTTVAEADTVSENLNQGIDTLSFGYLTIGVVVNLGSTSVQPVHANRTLKLNSAVVFENLDGGSGADTLFGNTLNNTLIGGAGDDKLLGSSGSDKLLGGANNDTYMFVPTATAEADQVTENANEGTDTLNFAYLTSSVVLNLGSTSIQPVNSNRTLRLNSLSTFENAVGGTGSDTLLGNAVANRLTGNLGDNILVGLEGGDILEAGSGRDILIGGLGLDILKGDAGDDILIAGRTTSDTSLSNLNTLRTQWISGNGYAARITNLRAGVGSPLVSLKATINVLNDAGEDDVLFGGTDTDWFFRAVDDVIADLFAGELIDVL
jgi:Ca2+-binding RTX toxin-like protein